jgi:hypothetical protein
MGDVALTLDQVLHIAELCSIAGGAIVVSFKIGRFTQAIESTNLNFVKEMEESKQDRQSIKDDIKNLSEKNTEQIQELTLAMQRDNVFSLQIANVEKGLAEVRAWYDELRRDEGKIVKRGEHQ